MSYIQQVAEKVTPIVFNASATLTEADVGAGLITVEGAAAAVVLTLPEITSSIAGCVVNIKRGVDETNTVAVAADATNNIDGSPQFPLVTPGDSVKLTADLSTLQWRVN